MFKQTNKQSVIIDIYKRKNVISRTKDIICIDDDQCCSFLFFN
jgi:hypothetical protein